MPKTYLEKFIIKNDNHLIYNADNKKLYLFDLKISQKAPSVNGNKLLSNSCGSNISAKLMNVCLKETAGVFEKDLSLWITIDTQEKERKRIAQEIHDSLGQEINAIKMYILALHNMDVESDLYKDTITISNTLLDEAVENIKDIAFDLSPRALEMGNLFDAIEGLICRLSGLITIDYNYPKFKINLPKFVEKSIYRIIQEFINNSIKYSKSNNISFTVDEHDHYFIILIHDNGIGFNVEDIKIGNGLQNISLRLCALKIEHQFISEVGKGTYIKMKIHDKKS